jgi:hypothetical protein
VATTPSSPRPMVPPPNPTPPPKPGNMTRSKFGCPTSPNATHFSCEPTFPWLT